MVVRLFSLGGYVSRSSESCMQCKERKSKNLPVKIPTIGIVEEMMLMGFYGWLHA